MNNPILQRFASDIKQLKQGLRQLTTLSARSEYTGGFSRVLYADLPIAGMKGRVFYILDARIGAEGAGAGSGALGVDNGSQWVYVQDQTQAIQI